MLVFVYGTLRRNYSGGMAAFLANNAEFVSEATCKGDMFMFGFPGVVQGEGEVKGDVYEVRSDLVLTELDRYEGHPRLFERTRHAITLEDGSEDEAWIYFYQGPTEKAPPIPDGDYLAHISESRVVQRT